MLDKIKKILGVQDKAIKESDEEKSLGVDILHRGFWGGSENYNIDKEFILMFLNSDGYLSGGIDYKVDFILSDGYYIEEKDDTKSASIEKKQAEERLEAMDFELLLRNVTTNILIFSNCYVEKIRNSRGTVIDLGVLDTEEIYPVKDENNYVVGYKQYRHGKHIASFDKEDLVHFVLRPIGSKKEGESLVNSVLYTLATKNYIKKYNAGIFKNHKPRGAWLMPSDISESDFRANFNAIKENKNNAHKDLILRGSGIEFKPFIDTDKEKFLALLKNEVQEILAGLKIPPVLAGYSEGQTTQGTDNQLLGFIKSVKSIQKNLERKINQELLNKTFGFKNINLRFYRPDQKDMAKEVSVTNSMLNFASMNEAREDFGLGRVEDPNYDVVPYNRVGEMVIGLDFGGSNIGYDSDEDEGSNGGSDDGSEEGEKKINLDFYKDRDTQVSRRTVKEGKPLENPLLDKTENRTNKIIKKYFSNIKNEIFGEISNDEELNRLISAKSEDPAGDIVERVFAKNTIKKFKRELEDMFQSAYNEGLEGSGKELNLNFVADSDAIDYINRNMLSIYSDLEEETKGKMRRILREGVVEGLGIGHIKDRINKQIAIESKRGETIARTELNRAANSGKIEGYDQAGINKVEWLAFIDERTSQICRNLNGKKVKPGELFKTVDENGDSVRVTRPPAHPNCRSTVVPAED